jgi:hypothetical protein
MITSHAVLIVLIILVVALFGWQEYLAHRLRDQQSLLWRAHTILQHCSIGYGYCCCGEEMAEHNNGMQSGHTPVDMGVYMADCWMREFAEEVGIPVDELYRPLNRR